MSRKTPIYFKILWTQTIWTNNRRYKYQELADCKFPEKPIGKPSWRAAANICATPHQLPSVEKFVKVWNSLQRVKSWQKVAKSWQRDGKKVGETSGPKFKQWHTRFGAWILRIQVYGLNTESPGLQLMKCRPGLSVFEPQTLVLSIWAPDLGSHCLNCRPGVALFELQTRGLTVWTTDLGSQYLITDLRHQYQTHPTLKSSLVGRGRSPKKTLKPWSQVVSVVAEGQRKEFFRWFSTERPKPTEIIRFEPAFIGVREDKMTIRYERKWKLKQD